MRVGSWLELNCVDCGCQRAVKVLRSGNDRLTDDACCAAVNCAAREVVEYNRHGESAN